MKKIIAIAAILATTNSFAFFGDNTNTNTNGAWANNGAADVKGNATGEGEGSFSMTFEGAGKTNGKLTGNGTTNRRCIGSGSLGGNYRFSPQ